MEKIKNVAIVGLGLIGGSIAARLCEKYRVVGVDVDADATNFAVAHGLCAAAGQDLALVKDAEVVFVCTPVQLVADTVKKVYAVTGARALITDVASVKAPLCDAVKEGMRFVGGHPMAGKECGGIRAYTPRMFENAYYPIVRFCSTQPADEELLIELVKDLGAIPVTMDASHHDAAVARVSHLPHAVAYTLVNAALTDDTYLPLGAGSFRDTTRVAGSDPTFWTQVALLNKDALCDAMHDFQAAFDALVRAVEDGDEAGIKAVFERARARRNQTDTRGAQRHVFVDIADTPAALGRVTTMLGEAGANIANVSILHSREGIGGVLDLVFLSDEDERVARAVLAQNGIKAD